MKYPSAKWPNKVGKYQALVGAGAGYFYDDILEYRVWMHPEKGDRDCFNGNDYYYSFANYGDAFKFSKTNEGAEEPRALILQKEHINEPETGKFIHIKKRRLTEWDIKFIDKKHKRKRGSIDYFIKNGKFKGIDKKTQKNLRWR